MVRKNIFVLLDANKVKFYSRAFNLNLIVFGISLKLMPRVRWLLSFSRFLLMASVCEKEMGDCLGLFISRFSFNGSDNEL